MRTLPMWVIYDPPRDFPEHYIARMWLAGAGEARASDSAMLEKDLNVLRAHMQRQGLVRLDRQADDDPAILEVWL